MTVPFSRVPANLRTPLFYVEFDNSMANTATATQRTLIIGGMLSSGTATAGIRFVFQSCPKQPRVNRWKT